LDYDYEALPQDEQSGNQFVLIDFSLVRTVDYSALSELGKLVRVYRQHQRHVFLVAVTPEVQEFIVASQTIVLKEPTSVCENGDQHIGAFDNMTVAHQWIEAYAFE
jgi:anti-anti-sigma regulatory factor